MSAYLSVRTVVQAVAAVTGTTPAEIVGISRQMAKVRARHIAMYFTGIYCPQLSLPQVGRSFGGRDHTTVLHGRNKIAGEVLRSGLDAQMQEISISLDMAQSVFSRIDVTDIPDADPLRIAERATTDHEVSRITYDEIRTMAEFVIAIIQHGHLIREDDAQPLLPKTLCGAALAVIKAGGVFQDARFGIGEGAALQGLTATVDAMARVYARDIGPLPTPKPTFKSSLNTSRKEAQNG